MNDVGTMLAWSAVQVTVLTLAAAVLYALAARREPAVASALATVSLVACLVLTLLAFCPVPRWWAWTPRASGVVTTPQRGPACPPEHAAFTADRAELSDAGVRRPTGDGPEPNPASLGFARQLWERLQQPPAPGPRWRWPQIVAALFLTGSGLGLLRLIGGLWALRRCRRRSRILFDPALEAFVQKLGSELGCRPRVQLAESPEVTTPATLGWWRPLILLPADWRTWSESERRAVLAHELAHVCRADYLARLLARLSLALHFYHPLVYWLVGRLYLQQELATDALAARAAGGRESYLVVLARMALRQEGRPIGWAASPFLSGRGTLMRRIQMLQNRSPYRPVGRRTWALVVALLVSVGIGASALRSPAQKETGEPVADRAGAAGPAVPASAPAAPFDLTYLAPDARGVIAFRPRAIFGQPKMKKAAAFVNALSTAGKEPEKDGFSPPIEEIDQVIAKVVVRTDGTQKSHPTSLMFALAMIRTAHDFDWIQRVRTVDPGLEEVRYRGQLYYRSPRQSGAPSFWEMIGAGRCLFALDRRTIVFESEENVRRLLERKHRPEAERPWAEDWKHVEHGIFAMAFDNRDRSWLDRRPQPDEDLSPTARALFENSSILVFGVETTPSTRYRAYARCATVKAGNQVANAVRDLLAKALKGLDGAAGKNRSNATAAAAIQLVKDCLVHSELRQQIEEHGMSLYCHGEGRGDCTDLIAALLEGDFGMK